MGKKVCLKVIVMPHGHNQQMSNVSMSPNDEKISLDRDKNNQMYKMFIKCLKEYC